jgi:hypothetical protein
VGHGALGASCGDAWALFDEAALTRSVPKKQLLPSLLCFLELLGLWGDLPIDRAS